MPAAPPPQLSPPSGAPKAKMVCDLLVRDKVVRQDQADSALAQAQQTGDRVEDLILEADIVPEGELLRALAAHYRVNFISTEKLAKAEVARALVNTIPHRFAEKIGACPVVFDPKTHVLTVVTADPDDRDSLQEAQLASGAREVKPVLARPAAVRAFITKTYTGDLHAFALLDRQGHMMFHSMRGLLDRDDVVPVPERRGREPTDGEPAIRGERILSAEEPRPAVRAQTNKPPLPESTAAAPRTPTVLTLAPSSLGVPGATPGPSSLGGEEWARATRAGASFLELLNVLVSLLENPRPDLRGHSAQVARLARRLSEKLNLDPSTTASIVCAAYLHDLGKMGQYHLTSLNCSEYEGHKVAAQKLYGVPSRLLEPVHMAPDTSLAVEHMYERWDGKGFPFGQSGKDVPLGARILAICDTYADLTQNPRNPYRKTLMPNQACAALTQHKGTVFDPNLVDLFHHTVLGEDLKARLLASRTQALLVDVDPEETTVLELRMIEQGFVVKTARSAEQAVKILSEGETDLVVGEVDLGPSDGLALLAQARGAGWGKDLPWVIYTQRQERAVAQRAFDLGVLDFVNKPANADVLVAKLKAMLDQRATARTSRGVSGSLREMGLPDIVQVLFHGRKTGRLNVRAANGSGEIHFLEGNVMDATWGSLGGDAAFFAMIQLQDGEFALDPAFKPGARVIHQSAEALLLEGMRRMDEGIG